MKAKIIYISRGKHLINKGVENRLTEAGFEVLMLEDNIDIVNRHRYDANIFLYYPEFGDSQTELLLHYLSDLCMDNRKSLCLLGDSSFIARVKKSGAAGRVAHAYARPLDINVIVADMVELAEAHKELRRRKSILVVDDDSDFLTIMEHWLKNTYTVDGVRSGAKALSYLELKHPDLILLDYEMPQLDGYEAMEKIRSNPLTARIPIIFLTGVNERESVMRVIRHKPDGYLLKNMKKSELLDLLDRFFTETILNQKRQQSP